MDNGKTIGVPGISVPTPYRFSFLGQPIVDCGHPAGSTPESGFDYPVEIHPPNVIVLQKPEGFGDRFEYVAFGWTNSEASAILEFDLWPPPRPTATAQLSVQGIEKQVGGPVDTHGYVIDNTGPRSTGAASLTCTPEPATFPNHAHCKFSAGVSPMPPGIAKADFARMNPAYAAARFELRASVGWK